MNRKVLSKIIGELKQDDNFHDWWKSDEIEIPFFNNKRLEVTFMGCEPEQDRIFIEEADKALVNFFKLKNDYRKSISELAYKKCMGYLDAIDFNDADEPLRQIKDVHEIWNFIYPTELYLTRRPYREQDIYVLLACECDWEQEHGLQFVFRQGRKLTRISDQDGHLTEADAYDKPDEEDDLLSKF